MNAKQRFITLTMAGNPPDPRPVYIDAATVGSIVRTNRTDHVKGTRVFTICGNHTVTESPEHIIALLCGDNDDQ